MKKLYLVFAAILTLLMIGGLIIWQETRPRIAELPEPSLKQLAKKHNIEMGNFAILTRINQRPYANILTSQFDFVLADNTPNWYFTDGGLRPNRNSYEFAKLDEVISFAEKNSMPVEAHHYLWGEEKWLPDWLKKGNYTKEELRAIVHEHIMTVGTHYSGRIKRWTVVNEAFTRGQHVYGLHDWWADHAGTDYLDDAFRWAREADPYSELLLNDFMSEGKNDVSNQMYDYIKGAKARGVPIDGIGMQMHIDGSHPPVKEEVIANMKRFAELGVNVYVTEFDVNMNDVPASASERNNIQGKIYYEMMRACIESKVCKSFAILGITDNETWYNYVGVNGAKPLPFDERYRPKPAFFSLREALEQQ